MDWLNFHHLRYFWIVAREGGLRPAAEKLGVSQPSISAQIHELEDALGAPLFRKNGRRMVLTDTGQVVLEYADDIFSAGRELLSAVRQKTVQRSAPFYVGVTDAVPKLVARELLAPALATEPAYRIVCREGKHDDLLLQLAAHRLDLVISNEPASSGLQLKTFNEELAACGVVFYAPSKLAKTLTVNFPKCLDGVPALLPTEGSPLRPLVEQFFYENGVRPRSVAEFDDAALMLAVAEKTDAVFPIHELSAAESVHKLGFQQIGQIPGAESSFYAITAERQIKHPAALAVTEQPRLKS